MTAGIRAGRDAKIRAKIVPAWKCQSWAGEREGGLRLLSQSQTAWAPVPAVPLPLGLGGVTWRRMM